MRDDNKGFELTNKNTTRPVPVKLLTKKELQEFYNPTFRKRKYNFSGKNFFVLKTTSKQFKKLYEIEYRKSWCETKAYLVEKYDYSLLLHKALKYVRESDVS